MTMEIWVKVYFTITKFVTIIVATPFWGKCEVATHIPENGSLESSGTPENSEHNCRGQNTLHWGVLYIIEKVLKCRCPKWPHMSHLDICSPSYGQKKGRESNWQFDSKSRESTQIRCQYVECNTTLESSRGEIQVWFRPCLDQRSRWEVMFAQTQRILYGGRWWLPPSSGRGESSESKVARGLSQHRKDAEWIITTLWLVLDARPIN
jgi:hypothetical protein